MVQNVLLLRYYTDVVRLTSALTCCQLQDLARLDRRTALGVDELRPLSWRRDFILHGGFDFVAAIRNRQYESLEE